MATEQRTSRAFGDGPIEPLYAAVMDAIGLAIDNLLNGDDPNVPPKTGFVLMVFPFDAGGRCNYLSNGKREDVIRLMKEQIAEAEKHGQG